MIDMIVVYCAVASPVPDQCNYLASVLYLEVLSKI